MPAAADRPGPAGAATPAEMPGTGPGSGTGRSRPPREVRAYAVSLSDRLARIPGVLLLGGYLHGSATLGGWDARVSDVDLLFVLDRPVPDDTVDALAGCVVDTLPDCPGTGLETSIVTRADAARASPPWRFTLHVAGRSAAAAPDVVHGHGHPGDPDLLLHYAVCRAAGWPVTGPGVGEVFGAVPRPAVLVALAEELRWGLSNAGASYTLLNACRALVYLREGELVGKTVGGQRALAADIGPGPGIRRALAARTPTAGAAEAGAAPLSAAEIEFVESVARRLAGAAGSTNDER